MGFLIEPGFGLAVGLGHIHAVHVNLIGFRGLSGSGKRIGVKHMHPGVLLGQVALAALVDVEALDLGSMDGLRVATLLAEQYNPIQIAVIPLRQQLGVAAVHLQTLRHGDIGVFQQLLVLKQQPGVLPVFQRPLHADPGGGGVAPLVEIGQRQIPQRLGMGAVPGNALLPQLYGIVIAETVIVQIAQIIAGVGVGRIACDGVFQHGNVLQPCREAQTGVQRSGKGKIFASVLTQQMPAVAPVVMQQGIMAPAQLYYVQSVLGKTGF